MTSTFYDLCNDVAFKKVFNEHDTLTIKFLNATLRLEGDRQIRSVQFLPQELLPKTAESKKSILDVKCTDQRGFQYIVEVQNKPMLPYLQRIQHYVAHTYSGQLKKAKSYLELKPVTMLSILNHTLFPTEVPYVSFHNNVEAETKRSYLSDMSYAFIELPKFTKAGSEIRTVEDHWIDTLKNAPHRNAIPQDAPDEIKEALTILEEHSWSQQERDAYMRAHMFVMDEESALQTAEQKGKEEGREEGAHAKQMEIARNLLSSNVDIAVIAKSTGLSIEEIQSL